MNNVTNPRRAANDNALPTTIPQQWATTTVQRAIRDGMSPAALLAVAGWNEKRSDVYRRDRPRLRGQAAALRSVAEQLSATEYHGYGIAEAA